MHVYTPMNASHVNANAHAHAHVSRGQSDTPEAFNWLTMRHTALRLSGNAGGCLRPAHHSVTQVQGYERGRVSTGWRPVVRKYTW